MTDETKKDEEPEPEWLKEWKKDGRMEQALRLEVLILQRDKLNRDLEHDDRYFTDWEEQNSAAARREWQRHQVAVNLANAIVCGSAGTFEERIRLARDADFLAVAKTAYGAAEVLMSWRERLKAIDEGKYDPGGPDVSTGNL